MNHANRIARTLAALAAALALAACGALPSFKYCDQVEYTRDGNHVHVIADCHAPIGTQIPAG